MDIKQLRLSHGLTQQAMADITGIPKRTLEDWECQRRNPPAWVYPLLACFLEHNNK